MRYRFGDTNTLKVKIRRNELTTSVSKQFFLKSPQKFLSTVTYTTHPPTCNFIFVGQMVIENHIFHQFITNQQNDQLLVGLLTQLVQHGFKSRTNLDFAFQGFFPLLL